MLDGQDWPPRVGEGGGYSILWVFLDTHLMQNYCFPMVTLCIYSVFNLLAIAVCFTSMLVC